MFDTARRYLRFQWWEFRRWYHCRRGEHIWSYFGRERVCRCCQREEHRDGAGEWLLASHQFAQTQPTAVEHAADER